MENALPSGSELQAAVGAPSATSRRAHAPRAGEPRSEESPSTSSTLKAFAALERLVEMGRPVTLAELAQALDMPKPSLHRTLTLFEEAGWVIREPGGRTFAAGPRLTRFGLDVLTNDAVARTRRTILRKLVDEVGETCNLAMLRKGEVVYLDRVEAEWPLRLYLPTGSVISPHCSASGKLLLAYLPKDERDQLINSMPLKRYTEHTITDTRLLATELDRIAATGVAVDDEEFVLGVVCVAAPVRLSNGRVVAALAIHAASARLPLSRALELAPVLNRAAAAISESFDDENYPQHGAPGRS